MTLKVNALNNDHNEHFYYDFNIQLIKYAYYIIP